MLKFVLFAFIVSYDILVVRSNPYMKKSPPSADYHEEDDAGSLAQNLMENPCVCTINETSPNSTISPSHFPIRQNVVLMTPGGTVPFSWRCDLIPEKVLQTDYHYSSGVGSYKLHTIPKVWNTARKICIEEGGHLAIINSQAEAHILLQLFEEHRMYLREIPDNPIYVGIHDIFFEGEWVTVQGVPVEKSGYNVWSNKTARQPDDYKHRLNCGAMLDDGKLADRSCYVPSPFFCEISET